MRTPTALVVALAVLAALALPGAAAAATYTVDSTGTSIDKNPGDGVCESFAGDCSLAAAIEEANEDSGAPDKIVFSPQFDGGSEDTIVVGYMEYIDKLPLLREALTIDGTPAGPCTTDAGVPGPCVGIEANLPAEVVRLVEDDISVDGVAFSGESHQFVSVEGAHGSGITGNWFGVGLDGDVAPNWSGIQLLGGSDGGTIGGDLPTEGNIFVGSTKQAIDVDGSNTNVIDGNSFGIAPDGTPVPNATDIEVSDRTTSGGLIVHREATYNEIAENLFSGGGTGIDLSGEGEAENELPAAGPTTIRSNRFEEETYGISGAGRKLEVLENEIEGMSADGMLLEGSGGTVLGNRVGNSGGAGIRIQSPAPGVDATKNLIGGNLPGTENEILGSGGAAIEVAATESSFNEIARNRGSGNGGLFIELTPFDPATEFGGPALGIAPPSVTGADETGADGQALPFSRVRVFRKSSAEPGELASFLGETVADASGNWSAGYPMRVPAGTIVAATQTAAAGTSELATAITVEGPPEEGRRADAIGSMALDRTPPKTRILAGPHRTRRPWVRFKFGAAERGASFQCSLDRRPFMGCNSPKTYGNLRPGRHLFRVRAVDQAGNVDPSPSRRRFTVLG